MFSYKGIDTEYNYKVGSVEANNENEAITMIKEQEGVLIVLSLNKSSDNKLISNLQSQVGSRMVRIENRLKNSLGNKNKKKIKVDDEGESDTSQDITSRSPILRMIKSATKGFSKNTEEDSRKQAERDVQVIFKENTISYDEDITDKVPFAKKAKSNDDNSGRAVNWSLLDNNDNSKESRKRKKLKVKEKEIIMFTRRLHIMLSSGVSLLSSLSLLSETSTKNMGFVLSNVLEDIKMGNSFSEALAKFPKQFNSFYVSLVSIGETSGDLDESLADIIKMKEQEQKVLKKVKTASIYPIMVGGVLVVMMSAASIFFLPRFQEMYEEQNLVVPQFTNVVFTISSLVPYGVIVAILAVVIIAFLKNRIPKVNHIYVGIRDKLYLRIPILKNITNSLYMYYFSSNISLMLKNGIRLSDTLTLTMRSINNIYIKSEIEDAGNLMTHGFSFSEALRNQPHFDDILVNITLTGEESGKMAYSLTKVSEYFEDELNARVDAMMEVVPPLSIVIISVIAAPVIIAAYLPILEISSGGGLGL